MAYVLPPIDHPKLEYVYLTTFVFLLAVFFVIPTLFIIGIPQLICIVVALLGFAAFLFRSGYIMEGLISSLYVLAIFGADFPIASRTLLTDPMVTERIVLYLHEPVAIILVLILIHQYTTDRQPIQIDKFEIIAIISASGFVLWSLVSALVGYKISQYAAIAYFIDNMLLLMMFLVTILLLQKYESRMVIAPFFSSITMNLFYSAGQSIAGSSLGITFLGEGTRIWFWSPVNLGVVELTRGFGGGFTGNPRALIALGLLLFPFVVYLFVSSSLWKRVFAILTSISVILLIVVANSDNGWIALLFLLGGMAVLFGVNRRFDDESALGIQIPLLGLLIVISGLVLSSIWVNSIFSNVSSLNILSSTVSELDRLTGGTLTTRLEINHAAIALSRNYPWFGSGGKNFLLMSQDILGRTTYIHNVLLANLAFLGLVGFIMYGIFLISVFQVGVNKMVLYEDPESRVLWGLLLLGLVGYLWYGQWMVIHYLLQARMGFWIIAGVVVGASKEFPTPTE